MELIFRELNAHVQHGLQTERVVAIMGPRQAGKTTLVQHQLKSERPFQYYNLKDPDIRRVLQTAARREFEHFADHLIVLDEVQQMPALLGLSWGGSCAGPRPPKAATRSPAGSASSNPGAIPSSFSTAPH